REAGGETTAAGSTHARLRRACEHAAPLWRASASPLQLSVTTTPSATAASFGTCLDSDEEPGRPALRNLRRPGDATPPRGQPRADARAAVAHQSPGWRPRGHLPVPRVRNAAATYANPSRGSHCALSGGG